MAFESTARNIELEGSILKAECRDWDGNWRSSSLDLNQYIGNSDGEFSLSETNFSQSAFNIQLSGAVLSAILHEQDQNKVTAIFDLNLCIANKNGALQFESPRESLLNCGSCFSLDGSLMRSLCLGYDGRFHMSSIDLNDYYENSNGDLATGSHFYYISRNVSIQPSAHSVLLKAELKSNHWNSGDFWAWSEVDLVTCILIRGGSLVFEKHDGLFDRDGPFARFFERVPFAGFIVFGIHAATSNEEHAKRALAICANSSIVCGGILMGAMIGGRLGAAIGASLATPLGILMETEIAGTIKDPQLQGQFEEATLGRYVYETLRNTLAAGAAAYLSAYLGSVAGQVSAQALGEVASAIGKGTVRTLSDIAVYWLLKKVSFHI